MAAQLVTRINRYIGTAAEIAAMTLTDIPTGSTFFESDTGILKILNAAGALVEAPSESVQLSGSNTADRVSATITIGTGATHVAGDIVSTDAGEILEFNMSNIISAGGSGMILASLVTLGNTVVFSGGGGYTLELFTLSPTVQATNAVFNLADDDLAGYLAPMLISTLINKGSNCRSYNYGHNIPFKLASGDTKLYGKLVCNGAETTVTGKVITINLDVVAL